MANLDWRDYRLFAKLGGAVLLLDQATKIYIHAFSGLIRGLYPPFGGWEVIPNVFNIVYTTNRGAAWGILSGQSHWLIGLAVVALFGIAWFRHDLELHRRPVQIYFGLITGGILGNTIDRLWHGHVIDFLDVNLQVYRWPTFNIADCGIVIGTCGYVLWTFRHTRPAKA
jgi:signal peptidase II